MSSKSKNKNKTTQVGFDPPEGPKRKIQKGCRLAFQAECRVRWHICAHPSSPQGAVNLWHAHGPFRCPLLGVPLQPAQGSWKSLSMSVARSHEAWEGQCLKAQDTGWYTSAEQRSVSSWQPLLGHPGSSASLLLQPRFCHLQPVPRSMGLWEL